MIFSIGVRHRTVGPVDFVCPRCGLDRTGTELTRGRWARVFGLPIVPLGEYDPVITCDDCGHESDCGVLDVPTSEQLAGLLDRATVAALVTAIRTSHPARTDEVIASAERVLRKEGIQPGRVNLAHELKTLSPPEARMHIRRLGTELTTHGKQGFLHRAADVAMSGAALCPSAREALVSMGCDLGMAAPHINGVLAVASNRVDA